MQVLYLDPGHAATPAEAADPETATGFYWLDIERSKTAWYPEAERWLDTHLHEHHLVDSLSRQHLPFYDGTDDYDRYTHRDAEKSHPWDFARRGHLEFR